MLPSFTHPAEPSEYLTKQKPSAMAITLAGPSAVTKGVYSVPTTISTGFGVWLMIVRGKILLAIVLPGGPQSTFPGWLETPSATITSTVIVSPGLILEMSIVMT